MSYYNFYTIDQIYREKLESDLLFKDSAIVKSFIDAGVIDQAQSLDRIFLNFYKLRIYKEPILVENSEPHFGEALNDIQLDILDCDYLYKYKYDKLLKTLTLKYNPIWNKDGEITHTSTRTPDLTTKDSGNSSVTVTHNTTVAESTDSTTTETPSTTVSEKVQHGLTVTETPNLHGSTSVDHGLSTVESPSTSQTTTHSTSPYDGGGPYVESEDVTSNSGSTTTTNSGTDTTTTSTSGSTETANSGTDTTTTTTSGSTQTAVSGSTDTKTTGTDSTAGTDGNTRTETGTDTIEEKTIEQGNIGVTTTQSMIGEERQVANFSILKAYCTDIANYICMSTYKTAD